MKRVLSFTLTAALALSLAVPVLAAEESPFADVPPDHWAAGAIRQVFETEDAIRNGADEIDMVISQGLAKSRDWEGVLAEIRAVKASCKGRILKVIIEACNFNWEEKLTLCRVVSMSGADFIKTSTGFAAGGATLEDVRFLREHISPDMRVKAAGGIRTFEQAQAMLEAGADRVGASALAALAWQ